VTPTEVHGLCPILDAQLPVQRPNTRAHGVDLDAEIFRNSCTLKAMCFSATASFAVAGPLVGAGLVSASQ
jgi:hypothetical protein